jgi:uncharacterized membrane protein
VASHEHSITVERPVQTVYNQWTQFESFPQFMEGVESIRQIDPTHTHWVTKVAGTTREFDAEITEQRPDDRIAWKSLSGPRHAGVVTFHRLNDRETKVMLQMDLDPEGFTDKAGDALGFVGHRVEGDLKRFKEFIESRPHESGAWRGNVSST